MLNRWLDSSKERADDLKRTLAAFDGASLLRPDGHDHVQNTFSKLSKQLSLLQERQAEPTAVALLERHFAVPSAVAGDLLGASPAAVPHLLSTRLDKEHEDQIARRAPAADALVRAAVVRDQQPDTVEVAVEARGVQRREPLALGALAGPLERHLARPVALRSPRHRRASGHGPPPIHCARD